MVFSVFTFAYLVLVIFWGVIKCLEQAFFGADAYYAYLYPDAPNANEPTFKQT